MDDGFEFKEFGVEDAVNEFFCVKCGFPCDSKNVMVCNHCKSCYHFTCLSNPIIHKNKWFCLLCQKYLKHLKTQKALAKKLFIQK